MTLEHIDSIIAFVLIIAGVSLIITALNQMVSALLGLRGTHLRWALTTLLANADQDLAKHSRQISEAVLQHSLIYSRLVAAGFPPQQPPTSRQFSRQNSHFSYAQVQLLLIILAKMERSFINFAVRKFLQFLKDSPLEPRKGFK